MEDHEINELRYNLSTNQQILESVIEYFENKLKKMSNEEFSSSNPEYLEYKHILKSLKNKRTINRVYLT